MFSADVARPNKEYDEILNIIKKHNVEISSITVDRVEAILQNYEKYKHACSLMSINPFD